MIDKELQIELDSLVDAIAQSLAIISGTIAETHGAPNVLKQMLSAKGATEDYYGPNDWRDRLLQEMVRIVATKARPLCEDDQFLQTLIASVLEAPVGKNQKH